MSTIEAAQELAAGRTRAKPWEIATAAGRRDAMRDLSASVAKPRAGGDHALADQVGASCMPPVDSARRKLQRMLIKQLEKRRQDREQDREKGSSK